jgi:hypothetical protein
MSEGSIWASLECQCCGWIAGGGVVTEEGMAIALQLFKNSNDTREKLRLNFHSLSVSELSEYGRKAWFHDGEIPVARNHVWEIWMAAHEWFYWISLSQWAELTSNEIFLANVSLLRMHEFISFRAKFFAFRRKKRSWNQAFMEGEN